MNGRRNKMKKSEKPVTGKPLPGSSTSFNAKQVRVMESGNISTSKKLNLRKLVKAKVKKTPTNKKTNKRNSNRGRRQVITMPSFSDLEKMFDDSNVTGTVNNPESSDINSNPLQTESKTNEKLTQNTLDSESNHCNVNNVISVVNRQIPLINTVSTPNSLNCINTVEMLSPYTEPKDSVEIIVIDDEEPQKIILTQERKRKKSISQNSYIIEHETLDFDYPQKIRRLSESSETSCAIKKDSDSSDSDVTILYDLEGLPKISPLQISRRFSPLPSTSTDSVTISKNDKSFMNSLSESKDFTSVKICDDEYQDVIVIDDIHSKYSTQEAENLENDSEVRVEKQPQQESYSDDIDVLIETNYNSSDLFDVDAIIAENECILTKYKTVENLPTIIEVESRQNITQINELVHVDLNCSTSNNQGTRSVPTQIATNENSTQSQNSNIRDINHRNNKIISRSTSVPINTVNQVTSRNSTVISPQNTRSVNQITNLETSDVASSLNCPICLENLRSKECASTICGHIFCMECIKRALKNTKRCPTCRKIGKGQGYHRLFL